RRQPGEAARPLVPAENIFAYLADNPDLTGLLDEFPQLTADDLRECFAQAQLLAQQTTMITFKKGVTRTVVARTHGLPDPDPSIHKGNIFRALVALLKPGRMLDLGAGKGNFSLSAAQLGWEVTAVDARTVRWPDSEAEPGSDPDLVALTRSVRWIQADVREFPIGKGEYDLICVLGLLHHLEVSDQIALLKRCSGTPTLLDTRIAKALVDREGPYEGMLVREHGTTREERDEVPTAAWGNAVSFQHTEESLLRLVMDCGYIKMLQMRPPHRQDYTFYLCLPSPGDRQRAQRREERRGKGTSTRTRRSKTVR
ncbi:MAG: methyltransferase domain-containing protein, partial [Chloroflexota bacterium]|nr:methyltransferase domain-containing protein [Chloroflexota bacterium]